MAKRTARRHIDRHGAGEPTVSLSAACETRRHAACRGIIVSLLAPADAKCECTCHRVQLPPTWQASSIPPCELAGDEGVAA